LALAGASAAAAQAKVDVRVVVVDSNSRPVPGADVSIVRELKRVEGSGVTDDRGTRTISITQLAGDHQVVARKIGFLRADRFFAVSDSSRSVTVRLVLRPAPQQLPTMTVLSAQEVKRQSYRVDADEIASSTRPIFDATDVLVKLRPDMVFSRMGRRMASMSQPPCLLSFVWVNGRRIVNPIITAFDEVRRTSAPIPIDVFAVLRTIRPEHIAEINYADCFDTSVPRANAQNAVFVALKPGVSFEVGRGTFVLERAAAEEPDPSPTFTAFRGHLLGVFDEETGDPIEDVAVTDSASGTSARTTSTGTITLAFLPEGLSRVRVSKPAYVDQWVDVSISPRDTLPITLTLAKRKP
jgi:hypothetical protein